MAAAARRRRRIAARRPGSTERRPPPSDQRVSVITLGVADLARARAFYEGLGWATRAAPDDDVVFFQAGGMIVALWDRGRLAQDSGVEDPGGWGGITLAHNVGSPAEVDAVIGRPTPRAPPSPAPARRRSGAATPECSSIPTGIRGRSLTTRTGRCVTTARSSSRPETAHPSGRFGARGDEAGWLMTDAAWVYLLRCGDGSLYCGWTCDLDRRLAAHRAGRGARYTRARLPVTLAASWAMADRGAARREEARIKRLPRSEKLALIG